MYSVIIVDDEKWIIEGLKAGVDWASHGFEVVGDAENGQKALELIESLNPDVVFTDIRMPGLNGLELIKKAKEKKSDIEFIVLSGYAEFAYAQKAISYGTFGYCLKPFELEEINGLLARLRKTLSAKSSIDSVSDLFRLYEAMYSGNTTNIKEILSSYDMLPDKNNKITPVVAQGNDKPNFIEDTKYLRFKMGQSKYGYLIYNQTPDTIERTQTIGTESFPLSIGIGYPICEVSEMGASMDAASLASYGIFSTGKSGIYITNTSDTDFETVFRKISDALKRKDRIQFVQSIEVARKNFHTYTFNIKTAYLLFNTITCLAYNDNDKSCGKFFSDYDQLYTTFVTADAMLDYLKENTLRYFAEETSDIGIAVEHSTIKEILKYINENLTQDISIHILSTKFFLNPNYMCQLFKKEVGENFIEYISRRRIEYACKLLTETDLCINQISDKCGFNDYFYFTRIFKRLNNVTPTQFRESITTK